MRILITVTTDIAFDQRVQKIATSFSKHGFYVKVFGRSKGIVHQIELPFEYQLITCWFSKSFLFYAEYNLRLLFILLRSKCDLICACDLDTLLSATTVSLLRQKKLIFDAHEYFEESIEIVNKKNIQRIWRWIGRVCIPHTHLRYTVSKSLAKELSNKYGKEFAVIRNVPESEAVIQKEKNLKLIWYQGAINEGRGLECMIECMVELKDYSFFLAGDGDILLKLQKKVQELRLEDRVRFLGRLKYTELKEWASQAFVGIDLLESKSKSYYYSLSNKTFDYIHAGLPSIQMNFPEYAEIHQNYNTGILIEEVNKKYILNAIYQLENSDYYSQCILSCHEASKIYNWESEEKLLIEMIRKID